MLLRWSRSRLGQSLRTLDETRDVLHDAYQVAIRKIPEFQMQDSKSFARWMRGIVTRVILKKSSSQYVVRRRPMNEEYQPPDLDLTPFTRLSLDELKNLRYRILKECPREDRLIYRLRVRGMGSEQIADHLGVTDRNVRQRFARTDAKLRLRMRRHLEGRSDA
jgi:RNA polymerase sigma factor (sigma-70 family)